MQNAKKNTKKTNNKAIKRLAKRLKRVRIAKPRIRQQQRIVPNNPVEFRNKRGNDLLSSMRTYNRYVKARYLTGLVHPDLAVKNAIPLKLYSDVPIPTASVGWHEQYQLQSNQNGCFLLAWRPNFYCDSGYLSGVNANNWSHLTFNSNAGLNGTAAASSNNFVAANYTPNISCQRYRMVSALLKVSYNGSVLNQSGTMLSCATFDPLGVALGTTATAVTTLSDGFVDRFGNFGLIVNGLWNNTVNITNNSEGLECLYVPLDPDDLIFERTGHFYGTTTNSATVFSPSSEGAHINYIVAGRNLPVSTNNILVDIYYNYEVIADPSSAPFLRTSHDEIMTRKDNDDILSHMSTAIKNGNGIKKTSGFDYKSVLHDAFNLGVKYLPKILSMV